MFLLVMDVVIAMIRPYIDKRLDIITGIMALTIMEGFMTLTFAMAIPDLTVPYAAPIAKYNLMQALFIILYGCIHDKNMAQEAPAKPKKGE